MRFVALGQEESIEGVSSMLGPALLKVDPPARHWNLRCRTRCVLLLRVRS